MATIQWAPDFSSFIDTAQHPGAEYRPFRVGGDGGDQQAGWYAPQVTDRYGDISGGNLIDPSFTPDSGGGWSGGTHTSLHQQLKNAGAWNLNDPSIQRYFDTISPGWRQNPLALSRLSGKLGLDLTGKLGNIGIGSASDAFEGIFTPEQLSLAKTAADRDRYLRNKGSHGGLGGALRSAGDFAGDAFKNFVGPALLTYLGVSGLGSLGLTAGGGGAGLSAELAAGAPELASTMGLEGTAAGAGAATGAGASMPPAIVDKAALEEMIALGGTAGGGGMMPSAILDPAVFEGAELGGASVLGGLEGFPELGQLALSAGEDFSFSPETFAGSAGEFDFGGSGAFGSNILPGEWDWLEKLKKIKGPISGGMSLLSGFMGLKQSRDLSKLSREAMNRSDPFGPERVKYAQELDMLRQDPSRVERLPGYKAGLQAVERKMASQGYLGSGNMMVALHDYGGRMYDAEANRLAQLAGAGISPNFGPALSAQASSSDLASRALASLGYGARQFLQ